MGCHFLFEPGVWLGAGTVMFSISPDILHFRTRWEIIREEDGSLQCTQRVEIVGGDHMVNVFVVVPKDSESFEITLYNDTLGIFIGVGVMEPKMIGWEFHSSVELEGFELYERTADDAYSMRAEYLSSGGGRTEISGKIWKGVMRE
jgi:hypothetical protein